MRWTIALGAIPVAVWLAWPTAQPVPGRDPGIVPKAVATEGVRAQRQDDNTFSLRWRPANDLPPTIVGAIMVSGDEALAGVKRESTARQSPPRRLTRRAALRGDVCARHGMRRVTYTRGRWQGWRCRR